MAKMVKAWNKRTGEPLPNPVPQSWLDKGLFPNLAASASAASRAASAEGEGEKQETAATTSGRKSGTDKTKEA